MRQRDALKSPRFTQFSTFGRLPISQDLRDVKAVFVGVPFDTATTYRPGARFGPSAIRQGSRLLRPFHPEMGTMPFALQQVADAGDIPCNPFIINEAISQIEASADELLGKSKHIIALGGDHTIALP